MKGSFKHAVAPFLPTLNGQTVPYGIGCAWLGRDDTDEAALRREAEVLLTAYEAGFRYFDTSSAYGESERVVGELVSQVRRKTIFVATKSRIPEAAAPREAAEAVRLSLYSSLERLRTDYLDLFQIHDVDSLSAVLAKGGVLELLLEARANGTIRRIGLATRQHDLLAQAASYGEFATILTYSDYTPIDRCATDVIALANRLGVGVINASPLLFGLLTGQDPRSAEDSPGDPIRSRRKRRAVKLYDLCRNAGIPLPDLALQFPTWNPDIALTLTGPAISDDVSATIAALCRPVPTDFRAQVERWYTAEQQG